jgi:hypothetical protein
MGFTRDRLDMATTTLIALLDLTQHGTFHAAVFSFKCLFAFALLLEITPHAAWTANKAK